MTSWLDTSLYAKKNHVNVEFCNQPWQVFFGINGDALWVSVAGEFRRVRSPFNSRDLSRSESHNFKVSVISEIDIEVMKISAGGTHDDGSFPHKRAS